VRPSRRLSFAFKTSLPDAAVPVRAARRGQRLMCVTSDPLAGHRARSERIRTRGSGRAEEADKIVRVRRVLPDLSFPTLPMT
jgi:hypothetical protein